MSACCGLIGEAFGPLLQKSHAVIIPRNIWQSFSEHILSHP